MKPPQEESQQPPLPEQAPVDRALELKGFSLPELGPKFRNTQIFLTEVGLEFKKITWPTRQQVLVETGVVIAVCAFLTGLVVCYDWVFTAAANRVFYDQ